MRALRNHLVLLVLATGLTLGVLPAAATAVAALPSAHRVEADRTVTVDLSRDSVKVGGTVDVTGTVARAPAGTPVQVQRGFGGTWVTVGTTRTTSEAGTFAVWNVVTPQTGTFLYRALVAGSGSTGPVSSDYAWLVVTAKHLPTIVSGFVEAGGPLDGSTVRIYLPRRAKPVLTTRTTRYGYFLAELPSLPRSVRVEASGGTGPAGKFTGTMIGITPNPNTRDSFYVNPASTLLATYLDKHPKSTRAAADRKVRDLLGLKAYHNLEWALGGRPSYFDGVKFLRTAKRNGGFDAYVASLVEQMDGKRAKIAFRSTASPGDSMTPPPASSAVAGLIGEDAAGALGVASQATSVINGTLGLMNLVGSLVGWSPSGGPSSGQILTAIDQVQSTLKTMIGLITGLTAEVTSGINQISTQLEQEGYTTATARLGDAYTDVTHTQLAYRQYVNDQFIIATCTTAPLPGQTTPQYPNTDCPTTDSTGQPSSIKLNSVQAAVEYVGTHFDAYQTYVTGLQNDLGAKLTNGAGAGTTSTDVFRDALLSKTGSPSGLSYLVDLILDENRQLMLPTGSSLVQTYTTNVISSQAWAYYLVMTYLGATNSQTFVDAISAAYLGDDYADWPTYTTPDVPPTTPTAAPPQGNLHDEVTYLQSVLLVPERMAVDASSGGLMYMTSTNVGLASTYLSTDPAYRAACSHISAFNTTYQDFPAPKGLAPDSDSYICDELATPVRGLNAAMKTFPSQQGAYWASVSTQGQTPGMYSSGLGTGWTAASNENLGTVLPRLAGESYISSEYYFNPGWAWYPAGDQLSQYTLDNGDGTPTYYPAVLDWMKLYFKYMDGTDRTCTWAVADGNDNSDPCFDMPVLLSRPLLAGEAYVPQ